MILRSFLYLDSSTVSNYLSSLDGWVVEGPVDHTQSAKHDKGLKASIKIAEGALSGGGSSETKEKRLVTDAAKFQRLYDLIAEDYIQYLDASMTRFGSRSAGESCLSFNARSESLSSLS
jgi:hypothetical protein